jgi:hypothetical protein
MENNDASYVNDSDTDVAHDSKFSGNNDARLVSDSN